MSHDVEDCNIWSDCFYIVCLSVICCIYFSFFFLVCVTLYCVNLRLINIFYKVSNTKRSYWQRNRLTALRRVRQRYGFREMENIAWKVCRSTLYLNQRTTVGISHFVGISRDIIFYFNIISNKVISPKQTTIILCYCTYSVVVSR